VKPCESPDWWQLVQLALVRVALEQLSPEEEQALWLLAEGVRLPQKQRALAEQALQKVRRRLNLEP
jgi:DNA-binding CsgD family transcriptional regulator